MKKHKKKHAMQSAIIHPIVSARAVKLAPPSAPRLKDVLAPPQSLSANGRSLIESFEGLSLTAYQDEAGVWTIGYGHTGLQHNDGTVYATCEALLYALQPVGDPLPLAKSAWPMFRANPRHTGRVGN